MNPTPPLHEPHPSERRLRCAVCRIDAMPACLHSPPVHAPMKSVDAIPMAMAPDGTTQSTPPGDVGATAYGRGAGRLAGAAAAITRSASRLVSSKRRSRAAVGRAAPATEKSRIRRRRRRDYAPHAGAESNPSVRSGLRILRETALATDEVKMRARSNIKPTPTIAPT